MCPQLLPIPGQIDWPVEPRFVFRTRGDGTATPVMPVSSSAWTLANLLDDAALQRRGGLIDTKHCDYVTLWVIPIFGATGATALQLQIRSLLNLDKFLDDVVTRADAASVAGSAKLTAVTNNATFTVAQHHGLFVAIEGGTNTIDGLYQITGGTPGTDLELDAACDDGVGNMSGADATILYESTELVGETPSGAGVTNLYPHTLNLAASAVTDMRAYHYTLPVAAAFGIRIFAKSVGAGMAAAIAVTRGVNQ
jgi:hypothetical protein